MKKGISYFGVRNPHWVSKDLEEIVKAGINYIVHTFPEEDWEFYLDTVKEIVSISKARGLEVYLDPWGVGRIFGGEAYSKFLLLNDDARMRTREGKPGYGACMNNPKTVNFLKDWVDAAYYVGTDYIFFDEPHFSKLTNKEGCFCDICRDKFRAEYGKDMERADPEELAEFRGKTKLNFIREIARYSKSKGLKNVLCLLPTDEDLSWEAWASIEELDVFGTDPYWILHPDGFENWMEEKVRLVSEITKKYGKESEIWIQCFKVKAGEEPLIKRVAETAKKYKIHRISAWSYKSTFYMSYIKSDNPELVWKTLLEAYSEL